MVRKSLQIRKKVMPLDRYSGEWLVLVGEKVIAHDKSLPKAIHEASRKRLRQKPTVFLVPRKDEGPYLLFL